MSIELLPEFVRQYYEVHEWKHATAILNQDFPGGCPILVFGISRKLYIEGA